MRILFLTSAVERVAGYWRAFYLAKNLAELGHHVTVICQRNKPSFRIASEIRGKVQIYSLPSIVSKNVSFYDIIKQISTIFMQTGINSLFSLKSFDIVHVFDALLPQNALQIIFSRTKLTPRKPVIFVDWDDWWGRGGILDIYTRGIYRITIPFLTFLEEKMPLYADGVTVTNETLKKRAVSVGVMPKNIFVVPNGTNIEASKPFEIYEARRRLNLPLDAIIYIFPVKESLIKTQLQKSLGKNIVLLAHKIVTNFYPNAFLLLLGKGCETWLAEARSIKIDRNVIGIDFQPADTYPLYLAASDFTLLPPFPDTAFHRARSPLRLMDYMAVGRPVIATALPEIKRTLGYDDLLIKPNADENDLAEKILKAIRNSILCQKLGKVAREKIKKQGSWRIISKQLEKIYCKYV